MNIFLSTAFFKKQPEDEMSTLAGEGYDYYRYKKKYVAWRFFLGSFLEAMSVILTAAMIFLLPASYSIIIVCTYPIF